MNTSSGLVRPPQRPKPPPPNPNLNRQNEAGKKSEGNETTTPAANPPPIANTNKRNSLNSSGAPQVASFPPPILPSGNNQPTPQRIIPNLPPPKIPSNANTKPPPSLSSSAKISPSVIQSAFNASIPPAIKIPPPNTKPAPETTETSEPTSPVSPTQENKRPTVPGIPLKRRATFTSLPTENTFPPNYVPSALMLTEEEAELVIELPDSLPPFPEKLYPDENQQLAMPESIGSLPRSNSNSTSLLVPTLSLGTIINSSPRSSSDNLSDRKHYEPLNVQPSLGIPKSKSNPNSFEPSTPSTAPISLILQNKVVSDPYGSLASSAQNAVNLAINDDPFALPEGKEEEEKREKRKNRVGRCYPTVEDDQFPNAMKHEYLDLYPPLSSLMDLQGCSFIEYAKKYFKDQKEKKKLSQKKSFQLSSLISHSTKLSHPLHTLESKEHQKIALDLFDRLKYYMTDKKHLDKQPNLDPMVVVQQHLDLALANPVLHDEVYAQVIKQLCNNPSKVSETKGWEFLAYVICTFPPASNELCQSLSNWLLDQTTRYPDAAWYCSQCLQRTLSRGNITRKKGPSLIELQYLRDRNPIICRISCFDGTQKAITIDPSVTIEKVFQTFCDRIQLDYSYRDFFKMFIILGNSERQIRLETGLIVDCIRSVELFYAYHQNKLDLSNAKLFIKQKIFLKRKQPIQSELLNRLLFSQVKADILSGVIPCNQEKDVINLTAILLQHELGDYDENVVPKLDQYLPSKLAGQKNDAFWWEKIKSTYFSMMATSKDDCKKKYVAIAQKLNFYGTSFYDIELMNADQYGNQEGKKLAINEDGIFVYGEDLQKLVLHQRFQEISRWSTRPEANQLEIQTNSNPIIVYTKLYSEVIKELNSYIAAMLARSRTVVAQQDHIFEATVENKDLLPFKKGDVIRVHVPDDGNSWEYGSCNGKTGNFPSSLVKRVWVK